MASNIICQLEQHRQELGLSIYRVSKESQLGRGVYPNWLKGASPTLRSVQRVANALGYEVTLIKKGGEDGTAKCHGCHADTRSSETDGIRIHQTAQSRT